MPYPIPAIPGDPLVASFLRRQRTWSNANVANAISVLNRWCLWLDDARRRSH